MRKVLRSTAEADEKGCTRAMFLNIRKRHALKQRKNSGVLRFSEDESGRFTAGVCRMRDCRLCELVEILKEKEVRQFPACLRFAEKRAYPCRDLMKLRQVSVFIENKSGTLLRVTQTLAEAGVDLRALFVPDTVDFGILRCLVSDDKKAVAALEKSGASCSVTDVIGVSVGDAPGGLERVLQILYDAQITVEYLYSFVNLAAQGAVIVMHVDRPDDALRILEEAGVTLISHTDLEKKGL